MPNKTKVDALRAETLSVDAKSGLWMAVMHEKLHNVHFVLYGFIKRTLDLVLSVSMLVALTPVFVIVAIVIKIDSPGPVLFRQERVGKNGRMFKICKFRSMVADNDMRDVTCEDKYTRVGRVIRRTSIDELPQLINVVLGQMSFIGPRPWVAEYWTNMNDVERGRAKVRPGITGLAAAKGRNDLSVFEKIGYDLEYVRDFGFLEDVKVVLLTFKAVVAGDGVDAGKSGIQDDIGALKAR